MLQFAGPWAGGSSLEPPFWFSKKNFIHYQAVLFKYTIVCNWYTSLTAIAIHTSCYALLYFMEDQRVSSPVVVKSLLASKWQLNTLE